MENIETFNPSAHHPDQIKWILDSFRFFDGTYKREAIDAAVQHREEITPHLLKILKDVVANPEKFTGENPPYEQQFYASVLLSFFKVQEAHHLFIKAFSLPGDLPSSIFGDLITGDLPVFLYNTCYGNLEGIKSLLLNKEAYTYCRSSAATALVYCVGGGYADRRDILNFFSTLFTGDEAPVGDELWGFIASCIRDLYPDTVMELIKTGYERGLISEWIIGERHFDKTLKSSSPEKALENIRSEMKNQIHESVHEYMEWWACFKQKESISAPKHSLPSSTPWRFPTTIVRTEPKIGRNDPCPCGSGKKYKRCCLSQTME